MSAAPELGSRPVARTAAAGAARLVRLIRFARVAAAAASLTLAAAATPRSAAAQLGPQEESAGWPAVEIGARAGYDNVQRQEVLGALLRIPVLPNGTVELVPSGDVTFLRGLKEYQLNVEAVYLLLAADDGGLYLGGGMGLRNTIPSTNLTGGRDSFTTWSIVVGIKLMNLERVNPMLEFRRIFAGELAVDPQMLSIGVTFELW